MIDQKQLEMLHKVFNDGLEIGGMKVNCKSPTNININCSDDIITIDFQENLPKANVKKIISLSFNIQGFVLRKENGTVKIKHFPDIIFDYKEQNSKAIGAYEIDSIDFSQIEEEILREYDDENREKMASKCLQYARDWATIANYGGVSFKDCSTSEQRKLKQQCSEFIKESIKNDEDVKYGSVILTFILLQIILPIIIKWIVERVFRKLFS